MKRALMVAAMLAATSMSTLATARPHDDHGPNHHWARGERLPANFRGGSYMVNDYGQRGWRAPPRGYAYYRTDAGDYVLAAIATGAISSIIANNSYAGHR